MSNEPEVSVETIENVESNDFSDNKELDQLCKVYNLNISGIMFSTEVVGTHEGRALLHVLNSPVFLQLVVEVQYLKSLNERLKDEVRDDASVGDTMSKLSKTGSKKPRRSRKTKLLA